MAHEIIVILIITLCVALFVLLRHRHIKYKQCNKHLAPKTSLWQRIDRWINDMED